MHNQEMHYQEGKVVSELCHEVKNALNCIIGFSHLLEEEHLDEVQKSFLHRIIKSSNYALELINNTLESSKFAFQQSNLIKAPLPLRDMVGDVIEMVQTKADEKNLKLNLHFPNEIPPMILGDRHRLAQVILNLLTNSIKFTQCGNIDLSIDQITCEKTSQTYLLFTIKDQGRGILFEKQKYLFSEFSQCELSDKRDGSGLGLAISKRLVELMGGMIWLAHSSVEGSTFCFQIPLEIPEFSQS